MQSGRGIAARKHEGTHQRAERDEGAAANKARETMRGRSARIPLVTCTPTP